MEYGSWQQRPSLAWTSLLTGCSQSAWNQTFDSKVTDHRIRSHPSSSVLAAFVQSTLRWRKQCQRRGWSTSRVWRSSSALSHACGWAQCPWCHHRALFFFWCSICLWPKLPIGTSQESQWIFTAPDLGARLAESLFVASPSGSWAQAHDLSCSFVHLMIKLKLEATKFYDRWTEKCWILPNHHRLF